MKFFTRFTEYKSPETVVTAHLLDPNRGYTTQQWIVGKDVEESTVSKFAKDGNLYIVIAYTNGEPRLTVCDRNTWNSARIAFDSIDSMRDESPALKMLREFKKSEKS